MPDWALTLNAGERWEVDEHTRESVQRLMEIAQAPETEMAASELAGEINALFAGCTLEGEAHEQLHHFLTELLLRVTDLYSGTSDAERKEGLAAIEEVLGLFDQYFE